jgi:hypothetical protein
MCQALPGDVETNNIKFLPLGIIWSGGKREKEISYSITAS